MATRHASPRLASQAPIVNIISARNSSWGVCSTTKIVKVRIVPSRASRDMRRWRRWIIIVVRELMVMRGIIKENECNIAGKPRFVDLGGRRLR